MGYAIWNVVIFISIFCLLQLVTTDNRITGISLLRSFIAVILILALVFSAVKMTKLSVIKGLTECHKIEYVIDPIKGTKNINIVDSTLVPVYKKLNLIKGK